VGFWRRWGGVGSGRDRVWSEISGLHRQVRMALRIEAGTGKIKWTTVFALRPKKTGRLAAPG